MSAPEYILSLATPEDALDIVDVEDAAIAGRPDEPMQPLLWPAHLKSATNEEPAAESSSTPAHPADGPPGSFVLHYMSAPENTYVKITHKDADGGEQLVAFGLFMLVPMRTPEQWAERFGPNRPLPKGINVPLYNATTGVRLVKRQKIIGSQTYLSLHELFVRPEHQRKGLGGRLVQWGMELAKEKKLPVYVEANEEGRGLYARYGLEKVDRVDVDLSLWGGKPGDWNRYALMYKPFKGEE